MNHALPLRPMLKMKEERRVSIKILSLVDLAKYSIMLAKPALYSLHHFWNGSNFIENRFLDDNESHMLQWLSQYTLVNRVSSASLSHKLQQVPRMECRTHNYFESRNHLCA